MQHIFNELGEIWDDLDRNTKSYLATIMAGSRQQSRFLALMNNYNRTMQLVTVSQNSAGEASRQFQTHLTGLEASMIRLTAAKEDFMMRLIDHNAYKGVIDSMRTLLDLFSGMHPILVLLIGAIVLYTTKMTLSAAATAAKAGAEKANAAAVWQSLLANIAGAKGETALGKAINYSTAALSGKAAAMSASMLAMAPYMAILAAVAGAIWLIAHASSATKREIEAMQEQMGTLQEESTVIERQADQLEELVNEQEELKAKITLTREESKRLDEINRELLTSFGELKYTIDGLGNITFPNLEDHLRESQERVKELRIEVLELEKVLSELELESAFSDMQKEVGLDIWSLTKDLVAHGATSGGLMHPTVRGSTVGVEWFANYRENYKNQINILNQQINQYQREFLDNLVIRESELISLERDYDQFGRVLTQTMLESVVKGFEDELDNARTDRQFQRIAGRIERQFQEILTDFDFNIQGTNVTETMFQEYLQRLNDDIDNLVQQDVNIMTLANSLDSLYTALANVGIEGELALRFFSSDIAYQAAQAFNTLENQIGMTANSLQHLSAVEFIGIIDYIEEMGWTFAEHQKEIENTITTYNQLKQAIPDLGDRISELQHLLDSDAVHLYNQALREMGEEFNLTENQVRLLIDAHGEYKPILTDANSILRETIEHQKDYAENTKELLEIKAQLLETGQLEFDQMLHLIDAYNLSADAFEVHNGILTVRADAIDSLIEKEGEYLDVKMAEQKAMIILAKSRLELEKQAIENLLKIAKDEATTKEELLKHEIAIEKIRNNVKVETLKMAYALAEEEMHLRRQELEEKERLANTEGQMVADKERQVGQIVADATSNWINNWLAKGRAFMQFAKGIGQWAKYVVDLVKWIAKAAAINLVVKYTDWGVALEWQEGHAASKPSAPGTFTIDTKVDMQTTFDWESIQGKFDASTFENRLDEINNQLQALDFLLDNLDKFNLDNLLDSLKSVGDSGKDAADNVKEVKDALKDAAEEIEEYTAKLDMWYNVLRQILVLERELSIVRKERELMTDTDDILMSLEEEIALLKQLEAQQIQRQDLLQNELEKTAIALMAAAGGAVTLSDDLKDLHVNQEAFLALSTGQKQIVDDLIHQFDDLSSSIHETEEAILDLQITMRQLQLQAADALIEAIRKAIQQQQKLVIAAIDHEIRETRKAHQEKMKMYDEELKAIHKIIDAKIKSLEEEWREEDFRDDLESAQEEELRLRQEINKLALDDSQEAQAKRAELEKQLADQVKTIEKMKRDYARDERKRELTELKDFYSEEVEAKKSAEEEKLEALITSLEEAKAEINYYYQEILNDEEFWAELRLQILEGNFDKVEEMVASLQDFFGDVAGGIHGIAEKYGIELKYLDELFVDGVESGIQALGESWNATKGIMNAVAEAQQRAITISNALAQAVSAMTAQVLNQIKSIQKAQQAAASAAKQSATQPTTSSGGFTHTKSTGSSTPTTSQTSTTSTTTTTTSGGTYSQGYSLGRQHGNADGKDGTKNKRKLTSHQLEVTRKWGSSAISGYMAGYEAGWAAATSSYVHKSAYGFHSGGVVSAGNHQYHSNYRKIPGGSNNRSSQLINDLFQTKSEEILAKLLKGEVVVHPIEGMDNFKHNISKLIENIGSPINVEPSKSSAAKHIQLNVNVDNMVADNKEHVDKVFTEIQRQLNKAGVL